MMRKIEMQVEEYKKKISCLGDDDEKDMFTQEYFFHGIPVYLKEAEYFRFRKRIAVYFGVNFYDVMIVGSCKFGFSPYKFKCFSLNSDVDVVIISEILFEKYYKLLCSYEYQRKQNIFRLDTEQDKDYRRFLRYFITGWMRPDLLPQNTTDFKEIKEGWDDFFRGISYGKSEVGDYRVKCGLFKSYYYAEKYYRSSLDKAIVNITERG
jgi:hypothetical protein